MQPQPKDKIILPLDVPTADVARTWIERLADLVGMFKIGLQLFTAAGPGFVREVVQAGHRVFLDLKFHDIPNTVRGAVASAAALGADVATIHLAGGPRMIEEAVAATRDSGLRLLGVTVLTSSNAETLRACGIGDEVENHVLRLASLGIEGGVGGLVASPLELAALRARFGSGPTLVIPGVRPDWADTNDQQRVLTPAEAVRAGADYLVVGRPITAHPDPREAARRIADAIASALG